MRARVRGSATAGGVARVRARVRGLATAGGVATVRARVRGSATAEQPGQAKAKQNARKQASKQQAALKDQAQKFQLQLQQSCRVCPRAPVCPCLEWSNRSPAVFLAENGRVQAWVTCPTPRARLYSQPLIPFKACLGTPAADSALYLEGFIKIR